MFDLLGVVARWAHLVSCVGAVGGLGMLLVGGRSDRPTAQRWEARVIRLSQTFSVLALLTGVTVLMHQTGAFEGRPGAAFEGRAILRAVLGTQAGLVWLVRAGVLLLLATFLALRGGIVSKLDWIAGRGEALLLGAAAIGLLAASSHAAAVEPGTARALAVDAAHLLATGVWIGGLVPLALLLAAASRPRGEDARPYAVVAARRFSFVALVTVVVLVGTGIMNTLTQVGTVAGLLGTTHGRLLLGKLGVLLVILLLARMTRARLLPALSGPSDAVGRPAMRRLTRFVTAEAALAVGLLAIVSVMSVTPPALHQAPTWPLPFRLSLHEATENPGVHIRVLVASQVAVLGLVVIIGSFLLARRRLLAQAVGIVLLGAGAAGGLPPLAVDAYPTTFLRPAVPYAASSIAAGAAVFRDNCADCHGVSARGDGPPARGLPRPAAALVAHHVEDHTAGDLYWWISHGIPGARMPAFAERLSAEERWNVINFIRALESAARARSLGPTVEPERASVIAPDFTYSIGPSAPRSLKDYRSRRIVLLVLYTLPASRPRLAELAERYDVLSTLGAEVIAAPTDAAPDAIRRLGAEPRILFPIVTDGAADIVQTYRMFGSSEHGEFLIDRQGYLRARWTAATAVTRDVNPLLAEIQQLNEEKAVAPVPEEHVH